MEKKIKNEVELAEFAKELAERILREKKSEGAKVVGLVGELGAGKTTLVKYFLAELGVREEVLSPTFILMKSYDLPPKGSWNLLEAKSKRFQDPFKKAVHVDCYRLENPAGALRELGFGEVVRDKENIVLVEWAERVKKILPEDTVWVELTHVGGDVRGLKLY